MRNYFPRIIFFGFRPLFALGFLCLITIALATPTPAYAITQLSCPDGSAMKWEDTGGYLVHEYHYWCEDSDGKQTEPIESEVSSCGAGYEKRSNSSQLEVPAGTGFGAPEVCVPASVSDTESSRYPVSCSGTWDTLKNPGVCIVRAGFAGFAAFFMWIGIKIATIAGALFDFVLQHAIVNFGKTLESIKGGIDTGWTALRDIANIVIISMFVFIAINIILGVEEFGKKKMIAKVLIIAVLINFSLLFTKMIIDASNFTAYQFYNSMVKGQGGGSAQETADPNNPTANLDEGEENSIAARFMQLLGVQGIGDSYTMLRDIQESQDNAIAGLMYGVLSLVFLLGVAFVFLYGAFLIVTRAILLVFLMLTSALAFASWLIPYHVIEEGWTTWWKTLIKTAIFGPILMIFLWMTSIISSKLAYEGGGTLGQLASNASSDANMAALFSFLLILGLLFASFKASSYFSHSISGFGAAQGALGLAALTPLGAASRVAGFAGRNLIGRGSAWGLNKVKENEAAGGWANSRTGEIVKRRLNSLKRNSFDALSNKTVRNLYGKMGGAGLGGDVGKGGFEASASHQAEAAAKIARQIALSDDQRKKLAEATEAKAREAQATPRAEAAASGSAAEQTRARDEAKRAKATEQLAEKTRVETENERHRTAAEQHEAARDAAQERRRQLAEQHDSDIRIAEQEAANAPEDQKDAARARLQALRANKQGALAAEDQNIRSAQALAASSQQALSLGVQRIAELHAEEERAGAAAAERVEQESTGHIMAMDEEAKIAGKKAADARSVEAVAKRTAMARVGKLYGLIPGNPKNDPVAQRIGHAITENLKKENASLLKGVLGPPAAAAPKASSAPSGGGGGH